MLLKSIIWQGNVFFFFSFNNVKKRYQGKPNGCLLSKITVRLNRVYLESTLANTCIF